MYAILRALVVRPLLLGYFRVSVLGAANVPRRGAVILASNHLAFIDSLFLPAVVTRRMTYLVASSYFAKTGILGRAMGWFLGQIGQLPIDRSGGSASMASLKTGLAVLADDGLIGIYPEGTRSRDGKLHRGRTGVARLVLAAGVPVVPVAIAGTDQIFTPGSRFPRRARITIRFGRPLSFDTGAVEVDAPRLRAITDEIMQSIAAMSKQEFVDDYAVSAGD